MIDTSRVEPFHAPLVVVIGEAERDEALRRYNRPPETSRADRGAMYAGETPDGARVVIIYLKDPRHTPTKYHEALHAAFEMARVRGIPMIKANEELFCYLQEHIVELIDEQIASRKLPRRKPNRKSGLQ